MKSEGVIRETVGKLMMRMNLKRMMDASLYTGPLESIYPLPCLLTSAPTSALSLTRCHSSPSMDVTSRTSTMVEYGQSIVSVPTASHIESFSSAWKDVGSVGVALPIFCWWMTGDRGRAGSVYIWRQHRPSRTRALHSASLNQS